MTHEHFRQVIDDYARLEPGEADTWNPLHDDVELVHRTELFRLLTHALRHARANPEDIAVLDVGCGNGRSTRMYLDLGVAPGQVTGLDLREGALARARKAHSTIRYEAYDGDVFPFPDGAFSWASLCTVLSSVRAPEGRRHLSNEIRRVLAPDGHLFFWDLLRANDFAGGDTLDDGEIFAGFEPVWREAAVIDGFRERDFGAATGLNPTHQAVLLRR